MAVGSGYSAKAIGSQISQNKSRKRIMDMGLSPKNLLSSQLERLSSISDDDVFKNVVVLIEKSRLSTSETSTLITELNDVRGGAKNQLARLVKITNTPEMLAKLQLGVGKVSRIRSKKENTHSQFLMNLSRLVKITTDYSCPQDINITDQELDKSEKEILGIYAFIQNSREHTNNKVETQ